MTVRLRDRLPEVTPRQHEVARLVARGLTNPQIAEELGISLDGAKYHVAELLGRLGMYSRAEIADWYHEEERRRRMQRVRLELALLAWGLAGTAVVAALFLALAAVRSAVAGPGGAISDPALEQPPEGGPPQALDTVFSARARCGRGRSLDRTPRSQLPCSRLPGTAVCSWAPRSAPRTRSSRSTSAAEN